MIKKINIFLYRLIWSNLPKSDIKPTFFSKKIRYFFGKKIIAKCGANVNFEKGALFSSQLEIGDNSGIGAFSELYGPITIGNNVMMGTYVKIYTVNHSIECIDIPMNMQGFTDTKKVIIDDDVWIGSNVIILPGVKIGKGSVIGAGSVITKNVRPYTVVAGNPAKIIKYRINN